MRGQKATGGRQGKAHLPGLTHQRGDALRPKLARRVNVAVLIGGVAPNVPVPSCGLLGDAGVAEAQAPRSTVASGAADPPLEAVGAAWIAASVHPTLGGGVSAGLDTGSARLLSCGEQSVGEGSVLKQSSMPPAIAHSLQLFFISAPSNRPPQETYLTISIHSPHIACHHRQHLWSHP